MGTHLHKPDFAAKGDLLIGTASGTDTILSVGSNAQVLTADSTQTTGVKWASGGGFTSQVSTYMSANQTITAGATTKVNFDTVIFDTGSEFNTTNKQFVVTTTGYYMVTARVRWSAMGAAAQNLIWLYKNNGSLHKLLVTSGGTGGDSMSITQFVALTAADVLDVRVSNNDISNQSLDSGTGPTHFGMFRVA